MKRYHPQDAMEFPRFEGIRTFMRLPHVTDLDGVDFVIAGVPFDTGATFRVGARFGPAGIRNESMLLRLYNPALDIAIFDVCSGVDYGDLPVVPGYLPESHEKIEAGASAILAQGVAPLFLGGDHSISLPLLRAVASRYGPVALIHFDAHSDLWDAPDIIITPHCSPSSSQTGANVGHILRDNLRRYLAGEPPTNVVDKRLGY